MNRIWISRQSSISIREQLSAQLLFAILSGRLGPLGRLPSVRDLARRVKVHPNTVSAAYQDLAARGWVKRKAGSGVFVCDIERRGDRDQIDTFVRVWMEEGLGQGFSIEALSSAFENARSEFNTRGTPRNLLVVHPDRNLACILAAELGDAVQRDIPYAGLEDALEISESEKFLLLTTTSGAGAVSPLHPDGCRVIPLKSIEELLAGMGRPGTPALIGIVSRSESILQWASLLIPALGLKDSDLIQRNPGQSKWRDGLAACDLIVADLVAAREVPKKMRSVVLRLIPDSFLLEAQRLVTAEKA